MGLISNVGSWIDRKFPDRVPAEEVMRSLMAYHGIAGEIQALVLKLQETRNKQEAFENGARAFDKQLREVTDELNKIKATLALLNRTRIAPVMNTSEPWKR